MLAFEPFGLVGKIGLSALDTDFVEMLFQLIAKVFFQAAENSSTDNLVDQKENHSHQ